MRENSLIQTCKHYLATVFLQDNLLHNLAYLVKLVFYEGENFNTKVENTI